MVVALARPKVFTVNGQHFIHISGGRGEALQLHLASHGVRSRLTPILTADVERLDLEGGTDPDTVQAILDSWEA
jgi:hypothetical protein